MEVGNRGERNNGGCVKRDSMEGRDCSVIVAIFGSTEKGQSLGMWREREAGFFRMPETWP